MQPDKAKMQHNAEIINKDDFYIDNADWIKVYLHYCVVCPFSDLRFLITHLVSSKFTLFFFTKI